MGILGGGSTSYYDKLLESATSQLNLEPNWAAILEICDSIRQKDVSAKYALAAMKKKIFDKNPHVSRFALSVLEACMKNCGAPFHDEVATREFMEELRGLIKNGSEEIKTQVLTMIQAWNVAFRSKPGYKMFQDTYNLLKIEGHTFPEVKEADAMFSADAAPEWAEGDVCHMCRVKFSTFTRQHHCRCCGQVFCAKCSAKSSIIPKYGIEREVRVCDPCYDQLNPQGASGEGGSSKAKAVEDENGLPSEYLNHPLSKEDQTVKKADADTAKAQEEEELQLAMALSLSASEVEKKASSTSRNWSSMSASSSSPTKGSSAPPMETAGSSLYNNAGPSMQGESSDNNPELSHYLNRSYWEEKKQALHPSAPVAVTSAPPTYVAPQTEEPHMSPEQNNDSSAFVNTLQSSLDMFADRMQLVTSKGRHIAMDSTVQSLFQSLTAMHPQLIRLIEDEEEQKVKYEAMLEKVTLIREARESLDDMRKQHSEKLRQQELEQEMLRRMQMEQKLELMRQQKQEYLEYQHQLQIQRQQELDIQQQFKLQQKQLATAQYYSEGGVTYPAGQFEGQPPVGRSYDGGVYPPQYPASSVTYVPSVQPPGQVNSGGYPVASAAYEQQQKPQQLGQETSPPQYPQDQGYVSRQEQYIPAGSQQQQRSTTAPGDLMDRPVDQPLPQQYGASYQSQYPGYDNQGQPLDMKSMKTALPPTSVNPQADYPTGRVSPYQYQQGDASGGMIRGGQSQAPNQFARDQFAGSVHSSAPGQYSSSSQVYMPEGSGNYQNQVSYQQQSGMDPGIGAPANATNMPPQPQTQLQQAQIPPQQQQQQQAYQMQNQQQTQFQQQTAMTRMQSPQQQQIPPQQQQQQQMPPQQQQQMPPQQQQQQMPPQQQQQMSPPQQQQVPQQQSQYPQFQQQVQQQQMPQQASYPVPQQQQPQQQQHPQSQPDIPASSHLHDMQLISFD